MKTINIAIDGPAGAGKSSIAKAVSAQLGYIYVDTGALYRTIALFVNENNIPPEISMAASRTSAIPAVRAHLLELQKKIARENNILMDGRDIGTVILPDADVKIFLTASAEERANRRYRELSEKPDCPSYEEILKDIIQRDYNDSHRETAPLKQAEDAILVDTTGMNLEESSAEIIRIIHKKIGG